MGLPGRRARLTSAALATGAGLTSAAQARQLADVGRAG
jgi:hypothetical protein